MGRQMAEGDAARAGARPLALVIGGRSGVGKTTVGFEVSAQLSGAAVAHCLVEGDLLDHAYPKPADDPAGTALTRRNLAALWGGYAALGHRRLIYTNTVAVLETDLVTGVMGGDVGLTAVLLTASDDAVRRRLARREVGGGFDDHVRRSAAAARTLDTAPPWVVRIATDGRGVVEIARDVVAASGWAAGV